MSSAPSPCGPAFSATLPATYAVRPHGSRYLVCRLFAGSSIHGAVVTDCPTLQAAERECAWQQAEHERDRHRGNPGPQPFYSRSHRA